jgi:Family of unknown function (DUF6435)
LTSLSPFLLKEPSMFSFLKRDPVKKLRQQYDAKAEQAMLAQRKGDMRLFADLTSEAEELWAQLEKLQAETTKQN